MGQLGSMPPKRGGGHSHEESMESVLKSTIYENDSSLFFAQDMKYCRLFFGKKKLKWRSRRSLK